MLVMPRLGVFACVTAASMWVPACQHQQQCRVDHQLTEPEDRTDSSRSATGYGVVRVRVRVSVCERENRVLACLAVGGADGENLVVGSRPGRVVS